VLRRLLFLLLATAPLLRAQDSPALLTTPRAIREIDRAAAARGLPAKVRGVVTFVVPNSGSFIVDDGTTGIFVAMSDARTRLAQDPQQNFDGLAEIGMLLEITGTTSSGGFAPVIIPTHVQKLGTAPLPPVKAVSVTDLQTGRLDCERVRVRGVVQHAELTGRAIDAARLELAGIGGHFVAYAANPSGFDPAKLIDAEVDLSGVALSFFNERAEFVGARVQLQGIEDLTIVKPAPADPFAAAETRLDALLPFSPDPPALHRTRVKGVVTVSQPGAFFYLQDGERAVRVSTRATTPLAPGDRVEVSGFVELWQYFAEVREAVFRKLESGPVPKAEPVTYSTVFEPKKWLNPPNTGSHLDGRRVELQGRLEKVERAEGSGRRLSLDCDGHAVFATIINDADSPAENLVPGSEVKVTGVCVVQLSGGRPAVANPTATGFQLLVHSPQDLAILRVPPWWTPQRLWIALGGTAVVLVLALTWASLLRRRVAQKSTQLAEEIGARRNAALEFEATLRERKRLAADLHDTLEQALTGLALQLEAVELFKGQEPERSDQHLQLAQQFLARSREDVRRSVWNLRAQGLEGRTLYEALREMVEKQLAGGDIRAQCELQGTQKPLPDFIAGNLLLLAQEAVTNAIKHAGAKTVTARLTFGQNEVILEVQDDGRGFDPAQAPGVSEGHFGLQGMRERVKRLGGTLSIEPSTPSGTRIRAVVPAE
jgi:signal transduction histidine kinase